MSWHVRRARGVATIGLVLAAMWGLSTAALGNGTTTVPLQEDHKGTSTDGLCADGEVLVSANWHFVLNNLDEGTAAGELTAVFANAGVIITGPSNVVAEGMTQHFDIVTGPDTLLDANAVVEEQSIAPGDPSGPRLVLSDVTAECAPGTGTIEIVKYATPPDGTPFDFTGDLGDFTLADFTEHNVVTEENSEEFEDLAPGSYTITELPGPTGWRLFDIQCFVQYGGTSTWAIDVMARSVTIDLDAGDEVYCTFFNILRG